MRLHYLVHCLMHESNIYCFLGEWWWWWLLLFQEEPISALMWKCPLSNLLHHTKDKFADFSTRFVLLQCQKYVEEWCELFLHASCPTPRSTRFVSRSLLHDLLCQPFTTLGMLSCPVKLWLLKFPHLCGKRVCQGPLSLILLIMCHAKKKRKCQEWINGLLVCTDALNNPLGLPLGASLHFFQKIISHWLITVMLTFVHLFYALLKSWNEENIRI